MKIKNTIVILGVIIWLGLVSYWIFSPDESEGFTARGGTEHATDIPGVVWTTINVKGIDFLIVRGYKHDIEVIQIR